MGQMLADDIIPMFTDFDAYLAQQQAESQALWDFWGGPNPVGELGNSLWNSFTTDLVNNPGYLTGNIVGTVGSFAIPGAGVIKGVSAVNKVDNAMDAASTAARACSFTGATVVLMANGELKPIASVAVGDLVVASDPETGEQAAKPVEQVFAHEDVVFDLVIGDEVISTTEDHPFWSVTDHRFERAEEFQPGELVLLAAGEVIEVSGVAAGSGRAVLAYNLAVEDIHTFHVGVTQVLVHNTCDLADPGAIRFSQSSVSATFRDGSTISDLAAGLRSGAVDPTSVPPIRLLDQGGTLFTLDNRRLLAFQQAGVGVPYRMATDAEAASQMWKFTTNNGGTSVVVRGG
jgi:hypothetical protein